jgi:hypothetical protein
MASNPRTLAALIGAARAIWRQMDTDARVMGVGVSTVSTDGSELHYVISEEHGWRVRTVLMGDSAALAELDAAYQAAVHDVTPPDSPAVLEGGCDGLA